MEERYVLSADPLNLLSLTDRVELASPPPSPDLWSSASLGGAGESLAVESSFLPEQAFLLHSLPGATKTIYLDFDGYRTRFTQWNTDFHSENIETPTFSVDDDLITFSDAERFLIYNIWQRVAEDFRPFEVNVTTQDPGEEALRKSGPDDEEWGQRVVIGGSTLDWYTPVTDRAVGGVAYGSFNDNIDTPCFVFGADYIIIFDPDNPYEFIDFTEFYIAETISHEAGHTLGLGHDGQEWPVLDVTDPDDTEFKNVHVEYYGGHGYVTNVTTSWSPIMGAGGGNLTQWSQGEYFWANNNQDDLAIITTSNGFGYRADDHGSSLATATPLTLDAIGNFLGTEGIIERNTDVDYFSFVVQGLGETFTFDISPFERGPNLDVLARINNSSGSELYRSNPLDDIVAGSQTFGGLTDGGWARLDSGGNILEYVNTFSLLPGTYFLTIEGTGRPITFIDPLIHPGPVELTEADVGPDDKPFTADDLPPDDSDWGYTKYGSLGSYSITGKRQPILVGVDFDVSNGTSPTNWTRFSAGTSQTVINNLINEAAIATPYDLSISTTGASVLGSPSASPINGAELPTHALPLDAVDGYVDLAGETMTFVWSGLEPSSVFQVYVFGHADTELRNVVTVTGGEWNGEIHTYDFTQTVAPGGLAVNDYPSIDNANSPGGLALTALSVLVISTETGEITINVSNEAGYDAAVAGLAIAPTAFGSIEGRKWNDKNGNRIQDGPQDPNDPAYEEGLSDWTVYLDLNNNGQLDQFSTEDQTITVAASLVEPLPITDHNIVTNDLFFDAFGEIVDVNVTLDISHTFPADLELVLISPAGTRVMLMNDRGGAGLSGSGNDLGEIEFDDAATRSINDIVAEEAPFTGSFRPMVPLSNLNGQSSHGVWTLEIYDDALEHTGVLNSWSLTVTLKGVTVFLEPFTVTDSGGNYSFTSLLPGLYYVREHFTEQQELDGWQQTFAPPPLRVNSAAKVTGWDFYNWIPMEQVGSIQGQKWNDLNGNGVKEFGELGLEGWTIYLDANDNGQLDLASVQLPPVASTNVGQEITDFTAVTSTLSFSGPVTVIGDVNVTLDISHTFARDLHVFLISPEGTQIELFTDVGGSGDNFQGTTLDDQAAISIADPAATPPYTGTFRPEGLLSALNGENPNGIWTLSVLDTLAGDSGILNGWSLTIAGPETFTTTDSVGNYIFENVAPGNYIVREVQQPGWEQTTRSPAGNTWWDVTIGAAGAVTTGKDFGNHNPALSDDHANSANDPPPATPVTVPGAKIGRIGVPGDVDWFSFSAEGGTTYLFEVELDTLANSVLRLIGPNGTTQLALNDDAVGLESVIRWTAPVDETYYLEVSSFGMGTGRYNLSLSTPPDDHGDDATNTTPLTPPDIVPGELETLYDTDWFSFTAVGGTEYKIQTILGTLQDSVLRLYNSDGITVLAFNNDAVGLASAITWTATANGTLYVEVESLGGELTGTYSLSITADDHGDNSSVPTAITAPGTMAGIIELPSDVDWFSFTATAGTHYLLEAIAGSLPDPILRLIGPDGITQVLVNDNFGDDFDSLIQWTATTTGTYYLEVSPVGDIVGSYTVRITIDDHGSNPNVATADSTPTVSGVINVGGDQDWFSFSASAGTTYRIETILGSPPGALDDSVLYLVHPDKETVLAFNDDTIDDLNSLIIWTAPTTATYYVLVEAFDPDFETGSYTLSFASTNVLPGDYNGDDVVDAADYVVWRKTVGSSVVRGTGADGNLDGVIGPEDLEIWRENIGRYRDDHVNSAVGATVVTVPEVRSGKIERAGDVDWFSFNAAAGTVYMLEVGLGTLNNSVLRLIGLNGTTEIQLNDDAIGLESVIRFRAPVAGTYYAEVKGFSPTEIGTYTLSISTSPDDHGDDAAAATASPPPVIRNGNLETLFDTDWFSFTAVNGTEYKLQTTLLTLQDSVLRLYGPNGITLITSNDNNIGLESFIRWTATANGTYYVEVVGKDGLKTGTYTLSIAADDHGDDASDPTNIPGAANTPGIIELPSDVDWFSFTATAGTHYLLEATPVTLTNPKLRLIGPNGTTELVANDNGPGADLASLIQWTAPANGTYYLEVSPSGNLSGTYNVRVTVDDHSSSLVGATAVGVPSSNSGSINVGGDQDWFSFNAVSGNTYRIETTLGALAGSVLFVHADEATILASDSNGGPALIFWDALVTATYYVRVAGFNPDTHTGSYTLTFASAPTPGGGSGAVEEPSQPEESQQAMIAFAIDDQSAYVEPAYAQSSYIAAAELVAESPIGLAEQDQLAAADARPTRASLADLGFGIYDNGVTRTSRHQVRAALQTAEPRHARNELFSDAAVAAWLNGLGDGNRRVPSDDAGYASADTTAADELADGWSDEVEGVDALFDLIGA